MRIRHVLGALVAGTAILGLAGGALAIVPAGTLDQHHECSNSPQPVAPAGLVCDLHPTDATYPTQYSTTPATTVGLGQTFTAGMTGKLQAVALYLDLRPNTNPPATFNVEIRATTAGAPSGAALATGTISTAGWPTAANAPAWMRVDFATQPSVTAGTTYAIVLPELAKDVETPWLLWELDGNNTAHPNYAGGEAYDSADGVWELMSSHIQISDGGNADFAFQTYMAAAATPRPSVTTPPTSTLAAIEARGDGGAALVILSLAALAGLLLFLVAPRRVRRS